MDPVTLLVWLTSGLAALAYNSYRNDNEVPDDYVIEVVHVWDDGWQASEILSPAALNAVGNMLDVDVSTWWAKIRAVTHTAILLAEVDGERHALALLKEDFRVDPWGEERFSWVVDQAFGQSESKVNKHQLERLTKAAKLVPAFRFDETEAGTRRKEGTFTIGDHVFIPILSGEDARAEQEHMRISIHDSWNYYKLNAIGIWKVNAPDGEEAIYALMEGGREELAGKDNAPVSPELKAATEMVRDKLPRQLHLTLPPPTDDEYGGVPGWLFEAT